MGGTAATSAGVSCQLSKQTCSHHSQFWVCQWKDLNFPELKKSGAPTHLPMPCSPLREPGTQTLTLQYRRLLPALPFHVQPETVQVFWDRAMDRSGAKTPTTSGITAFWKKQLCTHTYIHTHCLYLLVEHKYIFKALKYLMAGKKQRGIISGLKLCWRLSWAI